MIWTLIKIFLFIAIVAAVVYGVDVLNGQSQGMQIAVANYEFTLGPLQAVVAALLLLAVVWLVLFLVGLLVACLRFLAGDETAITRYFSRNRERRGYKALADSLTA
ncbi:MAG: heme biosynthesis HemY N-terminal domain-containing protein, partial [Pseudomonadota bacterium]